MVRQCARPGCSAQAVATFNFDGLERVVWVGPLAAARALSAGDLCRRHADRLRPPDFQLGDRRGLVTFHQRQVAGRQARERFPERQFGFAAQLVHQRPAEARGDEHLAAPCVAVTERVLAPLVDLETVMGVLDQRYPQPARDEARNHLLDQGGLAAAGPAGETEDAHRRHVSGARS